MVLAVLVKPPRAILVKVDLMVKAVNLAVLVVSLAGVAVVPKMTHLLSVLMVELVESELSGALVDLTQVMPNQ